MVVQIRFLNQMFFFWVFVVWMRFGRAACVILLFMKIPIMRLLFAPLWSNDRLREETKAGPKVKAKRMRKGKEHVVKPQRKDVQFHKIHRVREGAIVRQRFSIVPLINVASASFRATETSDAGCFASIATRCLAYQHV